jgi:formamidopyrimidine-DNA glycosylase
MPEGPEVKIQAQRLNQLLAGKNLKGVSILTKIQKPSYATLSQRLRTLMGTLKKLADTKDPTQYIQIESVKSKGKYIYFQLRLHSTDKNGVMFFGNHLGMTGNWRTNPSKYSHIAIEYDDGKKLYFDDHIKLGKFGIFTVDEMRDKLRKLGPDVTTDAFTKSIFKEHMEPYSSSRRAIAMILIDQSIVSGIGNYLRADILYDAKLDPRTPVKNLSDEDIENLYDSIVRIVKDSLEKIGTTIKTPSSKTELRGDYKPKIYDQTEDPLGNPISKLKMQGRTVYWAPAVQKCRTAS